MAGDTISIGVRWSSSAASNAGNEARRLGAACSACAEFEFLREMTTWPATSVGARTATRQERVRSAATSSAADGGSMRAAHGPSRTTMPLVLRAGRPASAATLRDGFQMVFSSFNIYSTVRASSDPYPPAVEHSTRLASAAGTKSQHDEKHSIANALRGPSPPLPHPIFRLRARFYSGHVRRASVGTAVCGLLSTRRSGVALCNGSGNLSSMVCM